LSAASCRASPSVIPEELVAAMNNWPICPSGDSPPARSEQLCAEGLSLDGLFDGLFDGLLAVGVPFAEDVAAGEPGDGEPAALLVGATPGEVAPLVAEPGVPAGWPQAAKVTTAAAASPAVPVRMIRLRPRTARRAARFRAGCCSVITRTTLPCERSRDPNRRPVAVSW